MREEDFPMASITTPLMRRYCAVRGYTLVAGRGMSPEGMFETFGWNFETAMLFLPINFVILDPAVKIEHLGYRQMTPPVGLGRTANDILDAQVLADWSPL